MGMDYRHGIDTYGVSLLRGCNANSSAKSIISLFKPLYSSDQAQTLFVLICLTLDLQDSSI